MDNRKFAVLCGMMQAAFITIGRADGISGHWEQRLIVQEQRGGTYSYYADTGKVAVDSAGNFTNTISSLPDPEEWTDAGTLAYIGNGIVRINGYDVEAPDESFQLDIPINRAMDCMLGVHCKTNDAGVLEDASAIGLIKSPDSSAVADLAGHWRQYGMFVERANQGPWGASWEKTTDSQWLTIQTNGNFSMPLYSEDWSGVETGRLVQTSIGVYGLSNETNMNLALNASKDLLVRGLYATEDAEDEFSFILYLKKGSSYQLSDLSGRWNLSSLYYVEEGEFRGEIGVMTITTNGTVSGSFTDWDGAQETLSGSVSIDTNGLVTFNVTRADGVVSNAWWTGVKFFLNAGKSVLAGCWTDDGELLMDFAVKAPSDTSSGIPQWWLDQYGITTGNPNTICSNGINTLLEAYIAGLNPNDPQSLLRVVPPSQNGSVIGWSAVSGRVYSVYWTTNLMNGFPTQPLAGDLQWPQGSYTNSSTVPKGYYKIDVRLK